MNATKKCPMCAEEIENESLVCRYCGAKFYVKRKGYCQNCHTIREVNEINQCNVCGNATIDVHEESKLIEESIKNPTITSEPAAQLENKMSGAKKAVAIIGTVVFSLLCGFPGIFSIILGLASLYGLLSPDVPPGILTETLEQSQMSRQELFNYSLVFISVGFLLFLIPIVFGSMTLRNKRAALPAQKRSAGGILARFVAFIILVGAGFLLVKVTLPSLSRVSLMPTATSVPVQVNITALNAQSPPGQSYKTAQQIADLIVDKGIQCTYKPANIKL